MAERDGQDTKRTVHKQGGTMRRPASLLLLLSLLMVCGGCVTVDVGSGAGSGVGVYSYLNGDLKAVVDQLIRETEEGVLPRTG